MAICISQGNQSDGHDEELHKLSRSGKSTVWSAPKGAKKGDTLLVYLTGGIGIMAVGTITKDTWHKPGFGWNKDYCARIGNVRIVEPPISLDELQKIELQDGTLWGQTKSWAKNPQNPSYTIKDAVVENTILFMLKNRKLLPSDLEPPVGSDTGELPPRVQATVSRLVRDTKLSTKIKALHNNRCQIKTCKHPVVLADGSHYAEGHHIRPLGKPHNGPDVAGNIICLCPNHHAACDLRAIQLVASELRKVKGHEIDPKFIKYHNQKILKKPSKSKN